MKIGIAGPITLWMVKHLVKNSQDVPEGYRSPITALITMELIKKGHNVSLFTFDFNLTKPKIFEGDNLRIHVGCAHLCVYKRMIDLYRTEIKGLIKEMAKDRCDIIHAHWTYEFALAALASGQPCLVTARDAPIKVIKYFPLFGFIPHPYRLFRLAIAIRVLRKCVYLTANSPYTAEHFRRYLGYRKNIEIVPNGIPASLLAPYPKMSTPRGSVTFAAILTGWCYCKNGRVLLKAFKFVKKSLPHARLIIFGNDYGKNEPAYFWAKKNNLNQGVVFAGYASHAQVLLRLKQDIDIYVHPSLEESFGTPVIEAMGSGIPVIGGSKSGAVPWLLDYGKAGLLTNVESVKDLTDAMISLANDQYKREVFAKVGWQRVQDNFLIEKAVDKYIGIYNRVIKEWEK